TIDSLVASSEWLYTPISEALHMNAAFLHRVQAGDDMWRYVAACGSEHDDASVFFEHCGHGAVRLLRGLPAVECAWQSLGVTTRHGQHGVVVHRRIKQ